jgi:hypothetical protein
MQNIALGPKKNMFMGGKSILAVGDFRQVKIKSYTLRQSPQTCIVLNIGMKIFNFHFLLFLIRNLTRNWVVFDEKVQRQA